MNTKPSSSAVILALCALVFGCTESETTFKEDTGSGAAQIPGADPGGGGSDPDPSGGPEPRLSPPRVIATTPENNAGEVDRTADISVRFSEDILGTSISGSSLTLSAGGEAVPGAVRFDAETNTLNFSPEDRLPKTALIDAVVDDQVADLNGSPLGEAYRWSFTTSGPYWADAVVLDADSGPVIGPQLASNARGDAIVVWVQDEDLYARIFDGDDGSWRSIERIKGKVEDSARPHVAMDPSGNAVVVWSKENNDRVYARRFDAGRGRWEKDTRIGGDDASNPRVAMDARGGAIAVWQQRGALSNNIYASRLAGRGDWGDPVRLENLSDHSRRPQVAMDANGNAVVVWRQRVSFFSIFNTFTVYANRFITGSGWRGPEPVGPSVNPAAPPELAMDQSGRAFVVWRQSDGGNQNIYASRVVGSGGWSGAVPIGSGVPNGVQPHIATDGRGNAFVTWRQFSDGRYRIQVNRFSGGWQGITNLQTTADQADDPKVAAAANGDAVVVWVQREDGGYYINARSFDRGENAWEDRERISGVSGALFEPGIALGADGDALAAWIQVSGGQNDLMANRYY
ncbi:Ig-like domain-containing protein [Marinobacter sp. chi1]|uniref:Ig-like domain-containing protein n=1 Tax=Marinobacter suaedae TaxID=3057675 RepID=A0ABT8W444_9GAMM|nr:Ig-like domain-containing protein [Marinobacter sp. chi1]MDO3723020.1 Ig-like domain-containing protein [Marinobacter sp. chi1]